MNWLQFLREHGLAGILADDMGLGKTLQTLVHIQIEKDAGRLTHPALIIAPVSLMGNWQREAERFCPELRSLVLHGKDRHEVAGSMMDHDIVIAPYSLLHRDRERWLEAQWHLVVLDEAQNIKNASTNAAQVASELQTPAPPVPVGHADGKPPGRDLEPVPLSDAGFSGQPEAFYRTVSHAD